jgi:anaerobic magnesium-protoporphyrin IX monomethyl ester cyclase
MDILFIYTNINGTHEETYAIGFASIVAVTKKEGHNVQVMIVKKRDDYSKVYEKILNFNPKIVAFTAVSSQFTFIKEISEGVKKIKYEIITVCGGVHTTIFPECVLEAPHLDGVFRGESEYSFVEFLQKVDQNKPFKDTDNFCYNENGTIIVNPLKPLIEDLDALPYPDKTSYPYIDTVTQYGIAPFFFSRGCPFLCSYCCNHAIAKAYNRARNTPRYRSAESSIREIEETRLAFPMIKQISIWDDTFGIDKKWRNEFCRKYKERVGIKFDCLLRANVIDEEFISLLKETGCYHISIGIESGNEYVRNTIMNRNISNEQITNAFALAQKYGLETNAINIIGVPGETEEMIWDTIILNRKIHPTSSGVNIFYPYKGTILGDESFRKGLVNEEQYRQFSQERRESVLNYPKEYKQKLIAFYKDWPVLVYPYDINLRATLILMKSPSLLKLAKSMKRALYSSLGWA